MHLKRLQLTGFKTFADKTEIEFSPGVTAIVGPNGSGKSNIADAVLWVLGEQKASAVRGNRAQDVIFSGSARRKSLGVCEVSLTVDNSDQSLPLAFDEVTISRRAYKSGDGEYFINKAACRLKDIYELFLDTGVGREAYALVNQSEIDAVLSADPEARRGLFEEAAGIKKYRVKKREALKKLEATETNLTRIRDILGEIEDQIGPLGEQAEIATRFLALKEELSRIEQDHLIVELRTADYEREAASQMRKEEEADADAAAALLNASEEQSKNLSGLLDEADRLLENCRRRAQAALSALERAESERKLAGERSQGLTAQIGLLEQELGDLTATHSQAREQAAGLEKEAQAARAEEESLRRSLGDFDVSAKDLSARITALQRLEEQRRAEAMQIARKQAVKQAEIARAEARLSEIENSLPALREELDRFDKLIASQTNAVTDGAEQIAALQAVLEAAQSVLADADAALKAARDAERAAQVRWDTARGQTVSLSARMRSLQELENSQEGYFAGVKAVIQAAKNGGLNAHLTVVADSFTAPPGYEGAFEAALGASIQNVITGTEREAKDAIEYLKRTESGRATFLPLDRMRPGGNVRLGRADSIPGFLGFAIDLIEFDPKFRPALETLLGRVLVCEGIDDALAVAKAAQDWMLVVTLPGEIIAPSGAMTGGRQRQRGATLLGRKTEISQIGKDLKRADDEEKSAQRDHEKARASIVDADALVTERRQSLQTAQLDVTQARKQREQAAAETARLTDQRAAVARRVEQSLVTVTQSKQTIAELAADLADGAAQSMGAEQSTASERDDLRDLLAEQERLRAGMTTERIALATLSERASSLDRAARSARADSDRTEAQIGRRREQCDQARHELGELTAHAAGRDQACKTAVGESAQAQQELEAAQTRRGGLHAQAQAAAAETRRLREVSAVAMEAVRKHELREQRFELQTLQLASRLLEEYDVTAQVALELDHDPVVPRDTPREVARMRRELRAMGEVNTGAVDEYQRLCDRQRFLAEQRTDSETAKERILDAIREIDEGTRDVFMESFNAVGEAFEVLFQRLFSGGGTQLVLTKPDDLLETGVEINVQLPGKKRQNLLLLSGGERALTATALLFAFLKVKPAPFCVLDEVDAPLDGVNVERFADLLRDFGAQTQFLVITHNPSTMEAAPIWYGVTMTEPGISRILSLEVPQIQG